MGKFKRKVKRSEEVVLTKEEIEAASNEDLAFIDQVIHELALNWFDIKPMNIFIAFLIYIAVMLTVEPFLIANSTKATAAMISHGVVTAGIFVWFFSFIKVKKDKPTFKQFLIRYLAIGIVFSIGAVITTLFM